MMFRLMLKHQWAQLSDGKIIRLKVTLKVCNGMQAQFTEIPPVLKRNASAMYLVRAGGEVALKPIASLDAALVYNLVACH